MPVDADSLLYVISAAREMSWRAFKKDFDALYMRRPAGEATESEAINHLRRRSIRLLDALGHCDVVFHEGDGRIYAAPPVLARLPIRGLPRAVLCGARSPDTINCLKKVCRSLGHACKVDVQVQGSKQTFIPRRVVVEAGSDEMLAEVAKKLQVGFSEAPPAWGLLHFSGSLQEYLETRNWSSGREINWLRRDFDTGSLQFRAYYRGASDVRLSSYDDPVRLVRVHFLWQGAVGAQVDRDWGRYGILQWDNKQVWVHDPRELILAVPASAPLPRLLARALTLSSGYAPHFVARSHFSVESPERYGFDIFTGIPANIAQSVASKLSQVLIESRLSI